MHAVTDVAPSLYVLRVAEKAHICRVNKEKAFSRQLHRMVHINAGERLYCVLFKYFLSTYDIQTASHAVYIVAKIASVDAVHTLV